MTKYVVTYAWEEACYVEAETPGGAESIADAIETDRELLELCRRRVRKATRAERDAYDFKGEDDG